MIYRPAFSGEQTMNRKKVGKNLKKRVGSYQELGRECAKRHARCLELLKDR